MKGWLIVNSFVKWDKFSEIYTLLLEAGKKVGVELELKTSSDILCSVQSRFSEYELPDFGIFWDKDILLASRLEKMGLRLFNSSQSIEACDDKGQTAIALVDGGIRTPKTFLSPKAYPTFGCTDMTFLRMAEEELGYPMIIKENRGSFGQQVHLVKSSYEAEVLIKSFKEHPFIMQEYIEESSGRDVRINVVGDRVVASMYRYNDNDFRSNITGGGSMKSFTADKEQEELAIAACKALGLDFAGVDVLFGKEGPIICEVNSNPHFKTTLECTGINMAEHIISYIKEYMDER
ncbi:MAG: RimK family alpha-L-glutamate ligase [Lachnospiraceae bacterium]|nr:RimK family alpha-L-glutamate ligase [Lachnospiraceae bacterium]